MLAAVPAFGTVTVEARRTMVSLATPRRIFAVVQATTRNRVDLGLRLEGPDALTRGGRLQPAKNLGAATVRIALTEAAQLDGEALGWLRLAYEQNSAPPPPRRRPAPRPRPEAHPPDGRHRGLGPARPAPSRLSRTCPATATCTWPCAVPARTGQALVTPGYPWQATEPRPRRRPVRPWEVEVTVRRGDDGLDFGGPFVRGDRTDRHIGLVWGDVSAEGTFRLIRGSKLKLADVDPVLVAEAMRPGSRLVARIRFADAAGHLMPASRPHLVPAPGKRSLGLAAPGQPGIDIN